jgi:hypothetical protein
MAIIKELNSSYGIKPSYHRITNISLNAIDKEVVICVGSYISKETRDKGCDPIDTIDILIPKEDYESFLVGDIFKAGYKWLKENVIGLEDGIDD